MRNLLFFIISLLPGLAEAQSIVYTKADSIKVMQLLSNAPRKASANEYMIHFGKALQGVPYVGKTLENNTKEKLVVNLRELDCTTFTENVLALSLCMRDGKKSFKAFTDYLRRIRYNKGYVSYPSRLHYFTSWIDANSKQDFVAEVVAAQAPFTATKTLNVNFMSQHCDLYPALVRDKAMVDSIRIAEKTLTGKSFRYIPKSALNQHSLLKKYIQTGDIIVIITNKEGLDTSHIGIASWHSDGTLHLLNASQIYKKVIDEPMTLYRYMQKHPSQIGIRVVSPL